MSVSKNTEWKVAFHNASSMMATSLYNITWLGLISGAMVILLSWMFMQLTDVTKARAEDNLPLGMALRYTSILSLVIQLYV